MRIMREALQAHEIHANGWDGIRDKSQLSAARWLRAAFGLCRHYPRLIRTYLNAPPHQTVVIGYPGLVDLFVLWPFAKARGAHIVWDMFTSAYDTTVRDRRMLSRTHPLGWCLYAAEWLACRMADRIVLDTQAHCAMITQLFGVLPSRFAAVPVGAEADYFMPVAVETDDYFHVLFYGQMIPLHGIKTILHAIRLCDDPQIRWHLIGSGQEEATMKRLLATMPSAAIAWIPWAEYAQLRDHIARSNVCLGIFGTSEKAGAVIPNKIYQALACGKPVITRQSPAIRELPDELSAQIITVKAGDAQTLWEAVKKLKSEPVTAQSWQPIEAIKNQWREVARLCHPDRGH